MKLSVLLFFLSPFFFLNNADKAEFTKVKTIKKKVDLMTTDPLGNLYIADKNFIWMYNNNGDSIGAFNSRRYGDISNIDATDPYKILVFFQDYNIVLFLDNYLSENGDPVDLQTLGFDQVVMACTAREKGIWIFDRLKQKAFQLDKNFEIIHETVNVSQWFGFVFTPNSMVESNNKLFLNEEGGGVYVFDHFATYMKKIALKRVDNIQVLENHLNYVDSAKFCQFNLQKISSLCKELNFPNTEIARVEKNRLYLKNEKEVIIYKTN